MDSGLAHVKFRTRAVSSKRSAILSRSRQAVPEAVQLRVEVPGPDYHRDLISCQIACPVRTDARAIARRTGPRRDTHGTGNRPLQICDDCSLDTPLPS
jgi:hypothetical protein